MDIKALLSKYIDYVGEMEGTDFIPKAIGGKNSFGRVNTPGPFTMEELRVLWECARWDEETGTWKEENNIE